MEKIRHLTGKDIPSSVRGVIPQITVLAVTENGGINGYGIVVPKEQTLATETPKQTVTLPALSGGPTAPMEIGSIEANHANKF